MLDAKTLFNQAIEILKQDSPDLLTTNGLATLLSDCGLLRFPDAELTYPSLRNPSVYYGLAGIQPDNVSTLRRIASDPEGWAIGACPEIHKGAAWYGIVGKMFGTDDMQDLLVYHRIREHVQNLQLRLGISGIYNRYTSIRDQMIAYPDRESQLVMVEEDYGILKAAVAPMIEYFLKVTAIEPSYQIVQIIEIVQIIGEDEEIEIPLNPRGVRALGSLAEYAYIESESHNWQPSPDEGLISQDVALYHKEEHPRTITLTLYCGWEDGMECDRVDIKAYHPCCSAKVNVTKC